MAGLWSCKKITDPKIIRLPGLSRGPNLITWAQNFLPLESEIQQSQQQSQRLEAWERDLTYHYWRGQHWKHFSFQEQTSALAGSQQEKRDLSPTTAFSQQSEWTWKWILPQRLQKRNVTLPTYWFWLCKTLSRRLSWAQLEIWTIKTVRQICVVLRCKVCGNLWWRIR